MPADEFSLSDPTLPVDPEIVARALGRALAERHRDAVAGLPAVDLRSLADQIVEGAAAASAGQTLTDGPFRGLRVTDLASLVAATIAELPASAAEPVPVRVGLTLADCTMSTDGAVSIDPATAIGDRHLDLAAAAMAAVERFGAAVAAPLIDEYGFDCIDLRTLDACQQLISVADIVGWPEGLS